MDRLDPGLHEDSALLGRVRAAAAAVLSQHGDDLALAHRTSGWVNPGWISNRYVVRVGLVPEQRSLHGEAALVDALPRTVGYPEVVAVGALNGHEYLLTRRVQGTNLSETGSLLAQVERFFDDRPTAPNVLNHGDLHIGNALWRRQAIVCLLDFEFAVIAPMELDLNELAKHVFGPSDPNDNGCATHVEQQAVADVASGLPVDATLLTGYSILLESWFTRRELGRHTPGDVRATGSCRRLVALADGEGGYLAPMLHS